MLDADQLHKWVETVLASGVTPSQWASASKFPKGGGFIREYRTRWENAKKKGKKAELKAGNVKKLQDGLVALGRQDLMLPDDTLQKTPERMGAGELITHFQGAYGALEPIERRMVIAALLAFLQDESKKSLTGGLCDSDTGAAHGQRVK